jgi:hypothetical protein
LLKMRAIKQQVHPVPRLIDHRPADAAMVAILVDEALTLHVDEHALCVAFGDRPGASGEELLHMDRFAARPHAEHDAGAVILVADGGVDLESLRAIFALWSRAHSDSDCRCER